MRKFAISLFAAFSLFTPLLVTGCQMGWVIKNLIFELPGDEQGNVTGIR